MTKTRRTFTDAFKREAVAHPLNGSGFVVPRVERTGILAASLLSVITVGVVLGAFATVSPAPSADDVIVLDRVTISAPRSA